MSNKYTCKKVQCRNLGEGQRSSKQSLIIQSSGQGQFTCVGSRPPAPVSACTPRQEGVCAEKITKNE